MADISTTSQEDLESAHDQFNRVYRQALRDGVISVMSDGSYPGVARVESRDALGPLAVGENRVFPRNPFPSPVDSPTDHGDAFLVEERMQWNGDHLRTYDWVNRSGLRHRTTYRNGSRLRDEILDNHGRVQQIHHYLEGGRVRVSAPDHVSIPIEPNSGWTPIEMNSGWTPIEMNSGLINEPIRFEPGPPRNPKVDEMKKKPTGKKAKEEKKFDEPNAENAYILRYRGPSRLTYAPYGTTSDLAVRPLWLICEYIFHEGWIEDGELFKNDENFQQMLNSIDGDPKSEGREAMALEYINRQRFTPKKPIEIRCDKNHKTEIPVNRPIKSAFAKRCGVDGCREVISYLPKSG